MLFLLQTKSHHHSLWSYTLMHWDLGHEETVFKKQHKGDLGFPSVLDPTEKKSHGQECVLLARSENSLLYASLLVVSFHLLLVQKASFVIWGASN